MDNSNTNEFIIGVNMKKIYSILKILLIFLFCISLSINSLAASNDIEEALEKAQEMMKVA